MCILLARCLLDFPVTAMLCWGLGRQIVYQNITQIHILSSSGLHGSHSGSYISRPNGNEHRYMRQHQLSDEIVQAYFIEPWHFNDAGSNGQ